MNHQQDSSVAEDYISIKWDDAEAHITQACRELRKKGHMLDVKIHLEEEPNTNPIHAHKLVLAACSKTLKQLLKGDHEVKGSVPPPDVIYLKGIGRKNMKDIISFMYNGEVKIKPEKLNSFLKAAQRLKVKGLALETTNKSLTHGATQHSTHSSETAPGLSAQSQHDNKKIFLKNYKIDRYIRSKTNISKYCDKNLSRLFHCGICYKKGTKRIIHGHIKDDHIIVIPFSCKYCGKEYKKKKEVRKHVEKRHQKVTKANNSNSTETGIHQIYSKCKADTAEGIAL